LEAGEAGGRCCRTLGQEGARTKPGKNSAGGWSKEIR